MADQFLILISTTAVGVIVILVCMDTFSGIANPFMQKTLKTKVFGDSYYINLYCVIKTGVSNKNASLVVIIKFFVKTFWCGQQNEYNHRLFLIC